MESAFNATIQISVAGTNGVDVDGIGATRLVFALGGAQHDDLVAIGDLAGVLEDLVGENHEVLAGLVMVILVDQEGLGAPRQGQPVEGVLIVGDAVDRGGRTFTGHAVHGGTGLGVGDDGLGVELVGQVDGSGKKSAERQRMAVNDQ